MATFTRTLRNFTAVMWLRVLAVLLTAGFVVAFSIFGR